MGTERAHERFPADFEIVEMMRPTDRPVRGTGRHEDHERRAGKDPNQRIAAVLSSTGRAAR
jgi:hypothetical protein